MGLTTWKNSPNGRVLKSDVIVAVFTRKRNQTTGTYRNGIFWLHRRIDRTETTFTMAQLAASVNKFLSFNDYKIMQGKGKMTKIQADKKAIATYEVFNKTQKIISDFDKEIKKLK